MPLLLITAQYCERLGSGLWAEPLNAISNMAFFIMAIMLSLQQQQISPNVKPPVIKVLIGILVLIGIGSLLWHTTAEAWAQWLDVAPIAMFVGLFLVTYLYRIKQLRWHICAVALAGFGIVHLFIAFMLPTNSFNGSQFYLPTLIGLPLLARITPKNHIANRIDLYRASVVFILAFIARSIDQPTCQYFNSGTHFIWHLFVATTMYYSIRSLMHD